MLVSFEIKNFLLIKKISINFIKGFNAFTVKLVQVNQLLLKV